MKEAGKRAVIQIQAKNPNLIPSGAASPLLLKSLLKSSPTDNSQPSQSSTTNGLQGSSKDSVNQKAMNTSNRKTLTVLHYNDVYNIDQNTLTEPVGGAARFKTAIKSCSHLNPLVLFSGDAFNPSMLSTFTQGEQMIPVLNSVGELNLPSNQNQHLKLFESVSRNALCSIRKSRF